MKKRFQILIGFIIILLVFAGCVSRADGAIKSLEDLKGKKVGVVMGTIHDQIVSEKMPESELVIYNSITDGIAALNNGNVDAIARSVGTGLFITYENPGLVMLDEHLSDSVVAFAFSKTDAGRKLNKQFTDFIIAKKNSGELEALREKWFAREEDKKTLPKLTSNGANGTLKMATTGTMIPYNYIRDNEIVGLEIELAILFCNENGYGLKIDTMDFSAVIPTVQTGKADFGGAVLAITPERQESVDFSEPYVSEATILLVRDPEAEGSESFFGSIRSDFEKTFIREQRYSLFLDGILVTLEINVLSVIFGIILGFCVYLLCRKGGRIPLAVTRFCVWLIQGMPVIVLLMIVYYIIFGKFAISPVLVSVISFTLVFAAAVYNMLCAGVKAVSDGQLEAAYALGFSDSRAFFKVILPQALIHVLPSFKAQIVALLKATAVVGYISVNDITRAGDLVRSRTYEPFFSLIAVAVMYFVLAGLLNLGAGLLQKRLDPTRRREDVILRGVIKK